MKLELKHIAPYLPFELKGETQGDFKGIIQLGTYYEVSDTKKQWGINDFILKCKPLLRCLYSLPDSFFHDYGFEHMTDLKNDIDLKIIELRVYNYLVSNHYDIGQLLENNLAIEIK